MAGAPLPDTLAAMLDGYDWHRVAAGESGGAVHRLTAAGRGELYLKSGRGRVASDIADEAARLRWLSSFLPVAPLRQAVVTSDGAWLLTGALPGRSGDEWFDASPDTRRRVAIALADFLRRFHAIPLDACPFTMGPPQRLAAARQNLEAGLVDTADFGDDHRGWSAEAVWDRMMTLVPDAIDPVVTHGDYSLGNLILDTPDSVSGCIDLGRVGIADRYQDIAILHANLDEIDRDLAALFLDRYGIAAIDGPRLAFHLCLDEFF